MDDYAAANSPLDETPAPVRERSELRRHFPIVLACHLGLSSAVGTVIVYTHGVFGAAIRQDLGWSATQYALPLTIFFYATALGSLLCGFLVDRISVRRVVLSSTLFVAAGLALLAVLPAFVGAFAGALSLLALLGCGTLPIAYSRVIVAWFDRQRGLALGLALTGVGTGATILPVLVQRVIDEAGWRAAYLTLAGFVLVVGFTSAFFLIRMPERIASRAETSSHAEIAPAAGRRAIFLLSTISLFCGIMLTSLIVLLVPIAREHAIDATAAAKLAAFAGISVVIGRLTIGYLLDRFFAPLVLAICLAGPAVAALLLSAPLGLQAFAVAAVLIGFAQGAEVDVVAYLVSRYLPPARFGRIFGLQFSLFTLGAANGPLFVVMASSRFGGFSQPLFAIALLGLLTSALCLLLPRYSRTPAERADAAAALPT